VESAILRWNLLIQKTLEADKSTSPDSFSLIAEIEFWRSRLATLSSISEQLNSESAKILIEVFFFFIHLKFVSFMKNVKVSISMILINCMVRWKRVMLRQRKSQSFWEHWSAIST
jgi:hypothetical protein